MKIQFEVYDANSASGSDVQEFWMKEWDKNFMKLVGHKADPQIFHSYDYYYILRFDGQVGAVMSSAWQNAGMKIKDDPYYSSWPDAHDYLLQNEITRFHKMGMIAADATVIPRGFKMTRVLIGCGMRFTQSLGSSCQGVVSFPRPDTSVYRSCVEWGARTVKDGLNMYNVPVNFIVLLHEELKQSHSNLNVADYVSQLWQEHQEKISNSIAA